MRLSAQRRLQLLLGLLFLALAIPIAVLALQAQQRMRWESFHQQQRLAEELGQRIDTALQNAVAAEQRRREGDYRYDVAATNTGATKIVQQSPLAQLPPVSQLPGLVGHFQVDAQGVFSTPLLPAGDAASAGLEAGELAARRALRERLFGVLERHGLVRATDSAVAQAAFDQLERQAPPAQRQALGRIDTLGLSQNFQPRVSLKSPLPQAGSAAQPEPSALTPAAAQLFDAQRDTFEFALLDEDYALLFRRVWRDGRRSVQGALLARAELLEQAIAAPFRTSGLAEHGELVLAWRGDVVAVVGATGAQPALPLHGELLHQLRLSAPLHELQLIWNVRELPAGAGTPLVHGTLAVALLVLGAGLWLLYRAGLRQLALLRQQQDFVAAVSHELRTPLTSVRLYAEMLREGWVEETQRRRYYDYLVEESERLSRLIGNVLQLARLERGSFAPDCRVHRLDALLERACTHVQPPLEQAGFTLQRELAPDCAAAELRVDADAFVQILINLADNARKFAAGAARREIVLAATAVDATRLRISLRDYGPGIAAAQRRRVFEPFYRPADATTRDTPGLGLGLALVRQLARAMGGEVDLVAREPGAEFGLVLPRADGRAASAIGASSD